MWTCTKCGEQVGEQFDSCWKCGTIRGDSPTVAPTPNGEIQYKRVAYQMFRGTFASWDQLFTQAAVFASEIGPDRVINISHSVDDSDGVVVVWYRATDDSI